MSSTKDVPRPWRHHVRYRHGATTTTSSAPRSTCGTRGNSGAAPARRWSHRGRDLVVALGGDGTFLRGARLAAHHCFLLLGIDFGHVGFFTEVPAHDVLQALDAVRESRVIVEERMLLTMRFQAALASRGTRSAAAVRPQAVPAPAASASRSEAGGCPYG
ncbi:NAD(+)/NADH kinase [Streptomyces sp. NPDC002514]